MKEREGEKLERKITREGESPQKIKKLKKGGGKKK